MLSATLPSFGSVREQCSYMNYQKGLSCLGYGLLGSRVFCAGCQVQSFSPPFNVKHKSFNVTWSSACQENKVGSGPEQWLPELCKPCWLS